MSDFASFVASVLRDKAFDDLLEENRQLLEKLSRSKAVEITGPGGFPVYAKGMIDQGKYGGGGESWYVELSQQVACHLESLTSKVEVRLGGAPLLDESFTQDAQYQSLDFLEECFTEEGAGLYSLATAGKHQSVRGLEFHAGTFQSYQEYATLDIETDEDGNISMRHFVEAVGNRPGAALVSFQTVEFNASSMQRTLKIHGVPEVNVNEERAKTLQSFIDGLARAEENGNAFMAETYREFIATHRERHEDDGWGRCE